MPTLTRDRKDGPRRVTGVEVFLQALRKRFSASSCAAPPAPFVATDARYNVRIAETVFETLPPWPGRGRLHDGPTNH
jgi:hypothetical protein